VATVARRHPAARIIIAHCGHTASDVALRLVAEHPGVYADLTPVLHQPVRPAPAELAAVAGKVLFGSDAPNTGLPVSGLLAGLTGLATADGGLSEKALAAITGGTARRLISEVRA
jgi:predicted TIM-barrel fold metal-dependent hydrolase